MDASMQASDSVCVGSRFLSRICFRSVFQSSLTCFSGVHMLLCSLKQLIYSEEELQEREQIYQIICFLKAIFL